LETIKYATTTTNASKWTNLKNFFFNFVLSINQNYTEKYPLSTSSPNFIFSPNYWYFDRNTRELWWRSLF
jgi:hypothetical protein